MKKVAILAVILGFYTSTQAQNVGIGTNTPARKLHVHGEAANFTAIAITNNASGQSSTNGLQIGMSFIDGNPAQQFGSIATYADMPINFVTNGLLRGTISGDGNWGIGTLSPVSKTHVLGMAGGNIFLAQPSASIGGISIYSPASNQVNFGFNLHRPIASSVRLSTGHSAAIRYDKSTGDLETLISSTSGDINTSPGFFIPLTFKGTTGYSQFGRYVGFNIEPHPDSGRVVIAHNSTIASPTLQLVEAGTTDFARIEFANQANSRFWQIAGNQSNVSSGLDRLNFYHSNAGDLMSLSGNGKVGIGAPGETGDGKLLINYNSSTFEPHLKLRENNLGDYSRLEFANTGAERVWHIAAQTVAGAGTTNRGDDLLNIWNSSRGDIMSFRGDGRVGILTAQPATGYALSVRGRIMCEELRVQLFSAWPDYVFADSYKLKSLQQVEQYIKDNKHLPGIPSAAEVEKEGIQVGDMQKRMMEKIEELTLYIIQQQKEIDALKEEVKK